MEEEIKPVTMKAEDAAKYLGVSYWLILEMVKQNKIPYIACGNRKLFRKAALDKWIEDMEKSSIIKPVTDNDPNNQYGKLRKIQ